MTAETLLFIALFLLFIGAWPIWPYASNWGYTPMAIFGILLAVVLIWAISGGRPLFKGPAVRAGSSVSVSEPQNNLTKN